MLTHSVTMTVLVVALDMYNSAKGIGLADRLTGLQGVICFQQACGFGVRHHGPETASDEVDLEAACQGEALMVELASKSVAGWSSVAAASTSGEIKTRRTWPVQRSLGSTPPPTINDGPFDVTRVPFSCRRIKRYTCGLYGRLSSAH